MNGIFQGCSNLKEVKMPKGGVTLLSGTFKDCTALTGVVLPEGVKTVGHSCFLNCTALQSVTLPEGLETIGYQAFRGCKALDNIVLPSTITVLDKEVFRYCSSLSSITIPGGVTRIDDMTFAECTSLSSVSVPSGVTYLGNYAFEDCPMASFTAPAELNTIGGHTFDGCTNLTTLTFPAKVETVGSYAFQDCNNLTDIYWCSNPNFHVYAFSQCNARIHLTLNDADATDFACKNENTYHTVSYTRALPTGKYGTIVLPFVPDAACMANYTFYKLTSADDGTLTFDEVSLPQSNAPYLYKLKSGDAVPLVSTTSVTIGAAMGESSTIDATWAMIPSFSNETIDCASDARKNYYAYSSANHQLNQITETLTVKPYRAYFTTEASSVAQVRVRTRNGEETIIDAVEIDGLTPDVYYDLNGRRVAHPEKGIYIVNGKKRIL